MELPSLTVYDLILEDDEGHYYSYNGDCSFIADQHYDLSDCEKIDNLKELKEYFINRWEK